MRKPKQIAAYHHRPESSPQEPDTAPGPYYVSAIDKPNFALVSGPYATHAEALAKVETARAITVELCPRAAWASFGTVRTKPDCALPGFLQKHGYDVELKSTTSNSQ